ncbi:MAG: hypothetical protein JOY62_09635 [Acidobacteriaceae bacterium]|nr:hypothetical protein [Acidobacteriaceae bacterium]
MQAGNDNAFVWLDLEPESVLKSSHHATPHIANFLLLTLRVHGDAFNRLTHTKQKFSTQAIRLLVVPISGGLDLLVGDPR